MILKSSSSSLENTRALSYYFESWQIKDNAFTLPSLYKFRVTKIVDEKKYLVIAIYVLANIWKRKGRMRTSFFAILSKLLIPQNEGHYVLLQKITIITY